MNSETELLSAVVSLPYRMFGAGEVEPLTGTTLSIRPRSVLLNVPDEEIGRVPDVGDQVKLILSLPRLEQDSERFLEMRARVEKVCRGDERNWHITVGFRKPVFKGMDLVQPERMPLAVSRWKM